MNRVCILGCGPAGLLAAHACELLGQPFDILSRKEKSIIHGAQYLHEPIPDISSPEPDGALTYTKVGTEEGYAEKVYGDPLAPTSWKIFPNGEHRAWSMTDLYADLWKRYHGAVIEQFIDMERLLTLFSEYPKIICSIPAKAICHRTQHKFYGAKVTFTEHCEIDGTPNMIMYSGDRSHWWYRTSRVFGHEATETTDPTREGFRGIKPTWHTCNCFGDVIRVGRFGKWAKGVLVHDAFRDTVRALQPRGSS